jgi:hypothetical protein
MLKNFRGGVFSAIHLLFVMLVLGSGLLLLLSDFISNIQNIAIHFLLQYPNLLISIGLFLFFFGIVLFCGFYNMYKLRYYKIRMGASKVLVEEAIIQDYIKGYWGQVFPNEPHNLEIIIHHKQVIEIVTKLPNVPKKPLLEKIQKELGLLLARKLGYEKKFILTIIE